MKHNFIFKSGGYTIELYLRSKFTVIGGDSASGKTFLFNLLKNMDTTENANDIENIVLINYDFVKSKGNYNAMVDIIKGSQNKLFVIDQADAIQRKNDAMMLAINLDSGHNTFILIGRQPAITYNISDLCHLKIEKDKISLVYDFDEPIISTEDIL